MDNSGVHPDKAPDNQDIRICSECDLVHHHVPVARGQTAYCKRCGKTLYRGHSYALERSLAFAVCGLAFFAVANVAPLLIFSMQGNSNANLLIDGGLEFLKTDYWFLGLLVLFASVIAPFLLLCVIVVMVAPVLMGRAPVVSGTLFRAYARLRPWAMGEIFIIGIIVAYVKLSDFADVFVGTALFGFMGMVISSVLALLYLDPRELWLRIEANRS